MTSATRSDTSLLLAGLHRMGRDEYAFRGGGHQHAGVSIGQVLDYLLWRLPQGVRVPLHMRQGRAFGGHPARAGSPGGGSGLDV